MAATTPRTQTFLTLWLDHGASTVNADAAYVIVPGASAQRMQSFAAPSIVANDTSASAVTSGATTGIVFWTAGATAAAGFSADAPSVVYSTSSATAMHIAAADPTNGTGTFHITVPDRWMASDAPYTLDARSTTLAIPRAGGATTRVTLMPAPTRRRAAGR